MALLRPAAAVCALLAYMGTPLAAEGPQEPATASQPDEAAEGCYRLSEPGCVCITEAQADDLIVERRTAAHLEAVPMVEPLPATPTWMAASVGAGFLLGALAVFAIVR